MKTLVVVGHPELADSASQTFFRAAANSLTGVVWHPLGVVFDRTTERQALWAADRVILQFPLYWYSAPAILKRWLDLVWDTDLLGPAGDRLADKQLGLVVTTGRALREFQPGESQEYTLPELLRPFQALARAAQMAYLPPFTIGQFAHLADRQRQVLLINYQQYLTAARPGHLASQVDWLAHQLERAAGSQPARAPQLLGLQSLLIENQEVLADLQDNLDLLGEQS